MAWLAVDIDNTEVIYNNKPYRNDNGTWNGGLGSFIIVPEGFSEKLLGFKLYWADDPIDLEDII